MAEPKSNKELTRLINEIMWDLGKQDNTAVAVMAREEQATNRLKRTMMDEMQKHQEDAMRYAMSMQRVTCSPPNIVIEKIDLNDWLMPVAKETRLNKKLLLLL